MFKNLTIKSRLIFVLSLLSALLLGIGYTGLYGMAQSNNSLQTVYEDHLVALGQVSTIRSLSACRQLPAAASRSCCAATTAAAA